MSNWLITSESKVKGNTGKVGQVINGAKYFVYYGTKDQPIDDSNINSFKMKTGLMKIENQFGQVVTEIGGKDENISTRKFKELVKFNDKTARFFLDFLYNVVWDKVEPGVTPINGGGDITKLAVQSPIDIDEAIKILSPLIEEIGYINMFVLDMKFNPKLTAAEVSMRLEDLKSKAQFNLNPMKQRKKF